MVVSSEQLMTRKVRLEELFSRWPKKPGRGFISDGIVDEDVWNSTSPKILFLMKEPNDPDGKDDPRRNGMSQ